MKKLLAITFALWASSVTAQVTTKPNVSNTLSQCLSNVPITGNGAGSSPGCYASGALTGAATATYSVAGSCTLADGSGATLTFTNTACEWNRIGNMIFVNGKLTYPSTANGSNNQINISGIGVNFLDQNGCHITTTGTATAARLFTLVSSVNFSIISTTSALLTNATMSLGQISFACVYPAS